MCNRCVFLHYSRFFDHYQRLPCVHEDDLKLQWSNLYTRHEYIFFDMKFEEMEFDKFQRIVDESEMSSLTAIKSVRLKEIIIS